MSRRLAVACISLAALLPAAAPAQTAPTVAESYARASAVLDSAIAAHGGQGALLAARQIRVTLAGHDHRRNQSRRVAPPYDAEPFRGDMMIDLARGRLIWETRASYPGGAHRATRFITDGERAFYVNLRQQTYSKEDYPPAATQTGNLYFLPQWLLLKAREHAAGLRWLGRMRLSSGAEVDVITTSTPQGPLTIGLDPRTRQLRAMMMMRADPLAGDAVWETEFVAYRTLNGVLLPTRRVRRLAGEVTDDYAYTSVTPGYAVPDSLAAPPAGMAEAAPEAERAAVRTLAPGVWAVGEGMQSLVVAFRDHVLVVDAPPNAAQVIALADSLAPGKPVRYVVPTHHHDDHAAGVAHYAAAGATLVTTPGNRAYLERMAAARATLNPQAPPRAGRVQVETVAGGRRVFTDGSRTVELHDIGPGPHAEEMLVAWIPEEGILFQGDLIDTPPSGEVVRGAHNETTAHFAEWLGRRGWSVRVFGGSHGFLATPAAFQELLRQPILPR